MFEGRLTSLSLHYINTSALTRLIVELTLVRLVLGLIISSGLLTDTMRTRTGIALLFFAVFAFVAAEDTESNEIVIEQLLVETLVS